MLRDPCITDLYQIGPDSDSTVVIETQDGEVMQRIWTPLSKIRREEERKERRWNQISSVYL